MVDHVLKMKEGDEVLMDVSVAEASKLRKFYLNNEKWLLGILSVGLFLSTWEIIGGFNIINPIFLSYPTAIARAGYNMFASGEIYRDLGVSGTEFIIGYGLAVVTGVPVGILAGWYRRLNHIIDPYLSALYATPRVALLPLIIIWVGIGIWSKIVIVFLGAFFPICINALSGVKTVEEKFLKAAVSFGADDYKIFKSVVLPSSVPFILTGLRLGVGRALVGVVVGELYAATAGIGFLITVAGATFQTDKVFVGVILIAAFGVLFMEILTRIERKFETWRPKVGAAQ